MNPPMIRGTCWIQVAGWLTLGLGVIHIAATPLIFPLSASLLADPELLSSLYMFEMTGFAVVFTGWLVMYASQGWRQGQRWAWQVCQGAGLFLLLLGAGAVLAMPDNPFAYLSLVIAIVENLPVWLYRSYFKRKEPAHVKDA
ncbi:MAG: hypothetical protein AB1894_18110 [Chloroflexota bacterium]